MVFLSSGFENEGFTMNYEPAAGIIGSDKDYTRSFIELKKISVDCAADYIRMIYS